MKVQPVKKAVQIKNTLKSKVPPVAKKTDKTEEGFLGKLQKHMKKESAMLNDQFIKGFLKESALRPETGKAMLKALAEISEGVGRGVGSGVKATGQVVTEGGELAAKHPHIVIPALAGAYTAKKMLTAPEEQYYQ